MPKLNKKGTGNNNIQSKSAETQKTKINEQKAMKPRTRSSSTLETVTNSDNSLRKSTNDDSTMAVTKKTVKRKIQYNEKIRNMPSKKLKEKRGVIAVNNNASPFEAEASVSGIKNKTPINNEVKRTIYAVSNANAIVGDGVDVQLHPNAEQSDFDSEESEYDDENDSNQVLGSQEVTALTSVDGRNEEERNEEDEFDALFENERVQRLFNKKLDKKLEAKLKEHNSNETSKCIEPNGKGIELPQRKKSYKQGESPLIKSPSDTTLHTPAIQRMTSLGKDLETQMEPLVTLTKGNNNGKDLINNISNFVETMRVNDDNGKGIEPSTLSGLNEVPRLRRPE